jgi:hypothetical protein
MIKRLLVFALAILSSNLWCAQQGTKRKAEEISNSNPQPTAQQYAHLRDWPFELQLKVFEELVEKETTIKALNRDVNAFAETHPRLKTVVNSRQGKKAVNDQVFIINLDKFYRTRELETPNVKMFGLNMLVSEYGDPLITNIISMMNNNSETEFNLIYYLVSHGADVNKVNPNSVISITPLIKAIMRDNASVAYYLVVHGVDVNKPDRRGRTPLMYAAEGGKVDFVRMLLNNGANVFAEMDIGDNKKVTAVDRVHRMLEMAAIERVNIGIKPEDISMIYLLLRDKMAKGSSH